MTNQHVDLLVIGSGPAGQNAALQGARAGRSVLLVERERQVGGACVHQGTIPSKTLREATIALHRFRARTGGVFTLEAPEHLRINSLMVRKDQVIQGHVHHIATQFHQGNVQHCHGRASFVSPHEVEILRVDRTRQIITADFIVIATGSRPREPQGVPIDHEHILDSDSILSMSYLPRSLTVLGAGVIASEYASIFAALGVEVTMIARENRPMSFLDTEMTERFLARFEEMGGHFIGNRNIETVAWDGLGQTHTNLAGGEVIASEKVLCALGRVANVEKLRIDAAGLKTTPRGLIPVDQSCRTVQPHIYAVGDVVGRPALAASAMEQGRRAVRHALQMELDPWGELIPSGIYSIPEISSIGLTETEARQQHEEILVGRTPFSEIARGQIAHIPHGLLKLVVHAHTNRILGVHIIGEGSTELIHLGQMAMMTHCGVDTFVNHVFNFPTLAEAYRVAALDIQQQRQQKHPQEERAIA